MNCISLITLKGRIRRTNREGEKGMEYLGFLYFSLALFAFAVKFFVSLEVPISVDLM
jgi:hypothetical protein